MSIIKKTSIALAMAAALGLVAPAMAANIQTPVQVANVSVGVNGAVNLGATGFGIFVNSDGSDLLLGRTTGFNVRINLLDGETFTATPTVTTGAGAPGWNAATVTAGGNGQNYVIINMSQNGSANGLVASAPFVTLSNFQVTGATALTTAGGTINVQGQIVDANTATVVNTFGSALVTSAYPLAVSYDTTLGDGNSRIDVGTGKIGFSANGAILADTATPVEHFNDGAIVYKTVAGLLAANGGGDYYASNNAADLELTTVLSGTFGPAFSTGGGDITLHSTQSCTGGTNYESADITGGDTATFADYTLHDLGVGNNPSGGQTYNKYVCFYANGTNVIDATGVAASTTSDSSAPANGDLLPLQYNGSVAFVPVFNPAHNDTAQSFLRVINPSNVDGQVTVAGIDDAGNPGTGSITFMLGAGQSMQLNSDDLEDGNADKGLTGGLGDGAGKWRLDVTGEFNGMRVQSLNRNSTNGTVTDLSGEVMDSTGLIRAVDGKTPAKKICFGILGCSNIQNQ